jgi:Cysteine-rich CPXCG
MKDEAGSVCESCGEEIVAPIDLTAGSRQEYVEDCPVCCRPNVIHVEIDDDGDVPVWAERE